MSSKDFKSEPGKLSDSPADAPDQIASGADGAYRMTEWFGAVFFYLVNFRRKQFDYFFQKKFERRNFWVGYLLYLLVPLLALIGIIWIAK